MWNTIKEIAIIVILSITVALCVNAVSPAGIPLIGNWETPQPAISDAPTGLDRIDDIERAKALYDKGVIFVDARSETAYSDGHIEGAVSLPVSRVETMIGDFFSRVPSDALSIVYCSSRQCEDAERLALFLKEVGYENIKIFSGGFAEWQSAGYPIGK